MDKEKALFFGIIGIILVAVTIYAVVFFGGRGSREEDFENHVEFEAPQLILAKDSYNERIKKLRAKPEKERDIELTNPFEEKEEPVKKRRKTEIPTYKSTKTNPGSKTNSKQQRAQKNVRHKMEKDAVKVKSGRTKSRYQKSASAITDKNCSAVVHGNQEVYPGSSIKLRLTDILQLKDVAIPRNTFIYGEVFFRRERVHIKVNSITYRKKIYQVDLSIYDQGDGIKGIHIPGGLSQEAAKIGTNEVLDGIATTAGSRVGLDVIRKVGSVVKTHNNRTTAKITDNYNIFLKSNDK